MSTSQIHECKDRSDTINFYPVMGLFLKPISRMNITIHYPTLKQSLPLGGKSISSWELMEKLKAVIIPHTFISIKVVRNTLEFIRFEADVENRTILKELLARLDGKKLKVSGFKELLKILPAEAKIPFPSKYDWDSFFRDARTMNEMKAGERPDTIHIQNLPSKWFSEKRTAKNPKPSERNFRRIWENFGEVRCIDIPVLDPYRHRMKASVSGIKTFTFSQDPVFEAYVQFKDYMGFVRAMDALRGCYLFFQETEKFWVANIKVDFDQTKHLTDDSIRRRRLERERLTKQDAEIDSTANLNAMEKERLDIEETEKMEKKIAMEERKYLIARRKLESIRLMDYLFERVKDMAVKKEQEEVRKEHEAAKKEERELVRQAEREQARQDEISRQRDRRRRHENFLVHKDRDRTQDLRTYREQLDHAYEKYFKSIMLKNHKSDDRDS